MSINRSESGGSLNADDKLPHSPPPRDLIETAKNLFEGVFRRDPEGRREQEKARPLAPRLSEKNRDSAIGGFNTDRSTRTESSFHNAVEKGKQLGKENEVSLELIMRDWFSKKDSTHYLTHLRGSAAIACSLGEFRLEEGSRIDQRSHADKKARILKGFDYDFGGEATMWLRMSAGCLWDAQRYVDGHEGLTIEGQKMDAAYMKQLKNLQTGVEDKLERIYGQHDVNAIYEILSSQVRENSGDWQQGLVRLKRELDSSSSTDNRFLAKASRDLALGYMAEANYMASKDNGEDAQIMFRDATRFLQKSMELAPEAPDNQGLQKIALKLEPQIQKAIDKQWDNPFNNPFEIPNPNRGVMA